MRIGKFDPNLDPDPESCSACLVNSNSKSATWPLLCIKLLKTLIRAKVSELQMEEHYIYKPTVLPSATSNHILAGTLNNFFVTKIVNIKQDLSSLEQTVGPMTIDNLDTILGTPAEIMDTYQLVSAEEVTKIIRKSPKATCLLDPAPTSLVVQFLPQLAPYITEIVNMSLKSASFPGKWACLPLRIVLPWRNYSFSSRTSHLELMLGFDSMYMYGLLHSVPAIQGMNWNNTGQKSITYRIRSLNGGAPSFTRGPWLCGKNMEI